MIAWDLFLTEVIPECLIADTNESELTITLTTGSQIALKGADNPDSLRGPGLDFLALDEFASFRAKAAGDRQITCWDDVLRPMLAKRRGGGIVIGTPQGFNHFYDMFMRGKDGTFPDWKSWEFTSVEGGFMSQEEVDAASRETDSRTWRQEYFASFESMAGRIYHAFNRKVNMDPTVLDISEMGGAELIVGMDFNVTPMTAVLGYRAADELHIFDEIEIANSNTQEMGAEIARRYGTRGLTPDENRERDQIARLNDTVGVAARRRDIRICPDPSGKARKTSAVVGETDFSILRGFGFTIDAPSSAPAVVDRINTVNTALCDASGRYRTKIHPRCKKTIKGLDGMTYKPGTKQPDKESGLDHITDALGYLVCQEFGVAGTRASSFEMHL